MRGRSQYMSMHMYMSCYVMYSMLHEHVVCMCVSCVCHTGHFLFHFLLMCAW